MNKYEVTIISDTVTYNIEAEDQEQAEEKAFEFFSERIPEVKTKILDETGQIIETGGEDKEEREYKIEDGFNVIAPYTLEELEKVRAMTDTCLFKKLYDNLSEIPTQMEDPKVLERLDEKEEK